MKAIPSLCPEGALAIAQGIALCLKRDAVKALKGRKQIKVFS